MRGRPRHTALRGGASGPVRGVHARCDEFCSAGGRGRCPGYRELDRLPRGRVDRASIEIVRAAPTRGAGLLVSTERFGLHAGLEQRRARTSLSIME